MKHEMTTCPYCGSETIKETFYDRPCWICEDCECLFDEEDAEREDIRHKVSLLLDETDEEHPLECDIIVGEHEAMGLSSLELPNIVKCFQIPGDGTMWFHEYGAIEFNEKGEKEDAWTNFDDYDIYDLREILKELEIQCNRNKR
jgi:hypothetical protein